MKKTLSISIAVISMALGFSACQEEDFGYTARQINYESEFAKTFGKIDPKQNWSTLSPTTIHYTLPNEGVYSVYVTSHALNYYGDNFLVASTEQVVANGEKQSIRFDMPKGYNVAYLTIREESTDQVGTLAAVICEGEGEVNFTGKPLMANNDALDNLKQTSYVVAFEDLGGSCDWDFNDIVVGVVRESSTQVKFTVRTAGGTVKSQLWYGSSAISFDGKVDIHEALGIEPDQRANVSTLSDTDQKIKDKCVPNVPQKSTTVTVEATATMTDIMRQLKLKVGEGGSAASIDAANDNEEATAPQAIVIYEAQEGSWSCPAEGQKISDVYPKFEAWVAKAELGSYWYGKAWGEPENNPNAIPAGTGVTPTEAQAPRR